MPEAFWDEEENTMTSLPTPKVRVWFTIEMKVDYDGQDYDDARKQLQNQYPDAEVLDYEVQDL